MHWNVEPKNQPNPRVSTAMETPRDDPAEPGSLNPGVTRRSVGRNREGHLWTSHLPDTVTKTSGGPCLCGGRANNVNIIMSQGKKQQPSTQNPRAYIHGIRFLNNWASWHLMQAPDLSRLPFPQWNRGKVITIMRGPWKDELKDLKWEESAACPTQVDRSQFSFACIAGTWGWLYHPQHWAEWMQAQNSTLWFTPYGRVDTHFTLQGRL